MKLSEVLKDWPEKMKSLYPAEEIYPINYLKRDRDIHNAALTSCDREIDREALAKELSKHLSHYGLWLGSSFKHKHYVHLADFIISTIPTWLKRSEK